LVVGFSEAHVQQRVKLIVFLVEGNVQNESEIKGTGTVLRVKPQRVGIANPQRPGFGC
jgi:hypothetical protein